MTLEHFFTGPLFQVFKLKQAAPMSRQEEKLVELDLEHKFQKRLMNVGEIID